MTAPRSLLVATATVALAAALGACSAEPAPVTAPQPSAAAQGDAPAAAAEPDAHNEADTQFAELMIAHHQGAIEMADLAVRQGSTAEVRALAERIAAAQDPEIEIMSGWLATWEGDGGGTDHGGTGHGGSDHGGMDHGGSDHGGMDHGGSDHGGMTMDGMTHEEAMADLSRLSGPDFDRRFLELMIAHHEGATQMAEEQVAAGESEEAVRLAEKIRADQTAEIAEMEAMLAGM